MERVRGNAVEGHREQVGPPTADRAGDDGFPGYTVLAELGRGAAASVLLARRLADDVTYALKALDDRPDDPERALAELCREAALMASVDHPGLLGIHEVGLHDGRPYMVMDLVEGQPLRRLLAAGPLDPDRVVALALDVADPLTAIHRAGLVHRDLKPDNIMIRPDLQAQLIDFGLASREAADGAQAAVGTFVYSPPEQAGTLSRPVDQRSDLYSLGVVLYECLTGHPPFTSADVGELLHMHAVVPPPDLLRLAPGTPPGLVAIVARLLAKEPDDRYQTGTDLLIDLRRLADGPDRREERPGSRHVGQPLVGRTDDLARLMEFWTAAQGGTGGVVAIRGGSGVGKTRLAVQMMSRVARSGAAGLYGSVSSDDGAPMAPLRQAIEEYLRWTGSRPEEAVAQVQDRLRACAGTAAPRLGRLSPSLAAVLGATEPADSDGQHDFPMTVAAFLVALAHAGGGLMIVIDDAQWMDSATGRVLANLVLDLPETPLLVVVITDGADAAESLTGLGPADLELTVTPLAEGEVTELAQAVLPGTAPDDALVRDLITRSKGNPLVVREYLRAIIDAGLLQPSWGRWLLDEAGLDALALPADALGLLLTRLHDVDAAAIELLATAAVVGVVFRAEVVAAVHAVPMVEVLDVLRDANVRGLAEPRAGGDFAFLHVGIRDALAERLDEPTAAARHVAIARALAALPAPSTGPLPDRVYAIARHYLAAGAAAPADLALPACAAAGELALDSHASAEAVTFLSHAVTLAGAPSVALLKPLGLALMQAGRLVEAALCLDEALALETDPLPQTELIATLADVYWAGWRHAEGSAMVARGLTELNDRLPRGRLRLALAVLKTMIAAVFMQRTGLGVGTVRADRRRRCALIADLHTRGFLLAGVERRIGEWFAHALRLVYWGNRIGEGPQYVWGQYAFGLIAGMFGMTRTSATAFARMNADPAASEPSLNATIVYGERLAAYMTNRAPEAAVVEALEEHGRRLDVGTFAEGIFSLVADTLGQGRNRDAARLWELAQHRVKGWAGERSALSAVPIMLAAARGRPTEAADHLRQLDLDMAGANGAALDIGRYMSWTFALSEQQEIGPPFDEAVAGYQAAGMNPALLQRPYRITLFQIAMGRIAQLRAATAEADRSVRLAQARTAVAHLAKGARDDVSRYWPVIARADLLVATGRPREALRLLDKDETIHRPAAPLLAFEQVRVRARAYLALGAEAESRRYAKVALTIAEEENWPHRAGWVTAEFAGVRASAPGAISQPSSVHFSTAVRPAGPGGTSSLGWNDDRRRLRALEHLGAASSRILDPEALARIALDEIITILHAERAFLFLASERDDRVFPHLGRDGGGSDIADLAGYSTSLVERVRLSREPLVMTGTEEGAALGAQSVVLHGLRSIMIAPLLLDDRLLGVVYLDSTIAKGIFTDADAGILIALANHIAVALETARAAQLEISIRTARQQRDLADRLRAAFEAMSDTLDPAVVMDRLLHWTAVLVPNSRVWLIAPGDPDPVLRHLSEDGSRVEQPIPADQLTTRLLGIREPTSDLMVPADLAIRAPEATSWMLLPLRSRTTEAGVLAIASADPDHRLAGEIEMAAAVAAQGMTAYDNASLFVQVRELATVDELTGIANRRRFFELAEREFAAGGRRQYPVVAMMLDIDHFKQVNDTYGHPSGDDVIREVARRMTECLRDTDILGRYGGEEFAIIAPDADLDLGRLLAERLRERIAEEPVLTRTGPLRVTVSIGLSLRTSATDDLTTVLARADEALYRAKQGGRNRTCSDVETLADR